MANNVTAAAGSPVKSNQRGVITLQNANATNDVTLTSVDLNKIILTLGSPAWDAGATGIASGVVVRMTTATNLNISGIAPGGGHTISVYYGLMELI